MTLEIREGDRKAAFDAALLAYGKDSPYVPPLWSDFDRMFDAGKNPFMGSLRQPRANGRSQAGGPRQPGRAYDFKALRHPDIIPMGDAPGEDAKGRIG